ncbi:MAG TPA: DUF3341 domain-containing protein [Steroidobacteraceae bacterium]|jgi:hypothetical protein
MSAARSYGVLAEFSSADQLMRAATQLRAELPGCALEAYSPFPIDGLAEALGDRDRIPLLMLLGALGGGIGTFLLEWYSAAVDYPFNVGGRPVDSWQAFLPPAAEMTLLGAALLGIVALLVSTGLPRLHHPLFNVAAFERATNDRFFLVLRSSRRQGSNQQARAILSTLSPLSITDVPSTSS